MSPESATADELAGRSGTHPRYAQEWLEIQSAFGILDADLAVDPVRFYELVTD